MSQNFFKPADTNLFYIASHALLSNRFDDKQYIKSEGSVVEFSKESANKRGRCTEWTFENL